ncbi:MAG TPA: rRNA maturation RNase YbeY [Burkholderiales bacterium]
MQRAVTGAPSAALLRQYAHAANPGKALTLRIVGALEAGKLNKRYRAKNYATNVLSFAYGSGSGDVVLCHPVIAREARAQRKTLRAHYAHLVVHGVLHLRGHDHLRKREAARMERAEIRILRRLGFGDPYA